MRKAIPIGCLLAATLSGCGTYVPELQEFPGGPVERQQFVAAIVNNINCELRDSVYALYKNDAHTFLDGWGIQTTLQLSSTEKSEVNPVVNWVPHGTFNMALGLDGSAEATREDSINSFLLVDKIKTAPCSPGVRTGGPFLMQSDLKLKQLLFDAYTAKELGSADFEGVKDEVLTHHLKFLIDTNGDVTPTYKITRVEVNSTGKFLSLQRTRTQDLIITMGPTDKPKKGGSKTTIAEKTGPISRAEFQHLSYTIGAAVSQGIRSALSP